ncbi:MAG: hypothetical protein HY320_16435 [Armatimonadetes bacterium]|nr:hypothetical protein [Armatimonadota bacterium]
MANASADALRDCYSRLQEFIAPYAGRVEYGNLRCRVSDWENPDHGLVTNVALVYETPGGSTDQINLSFHHAAGTFTILDDDLTEICTDCVDTVLSKVMPRIREIPAKRRRHLEEEVRRQLDNGVSRKALVAHLTRVLQSEFKGGTITHLELRDAMTFAVRYANQRPPGDGDGASIPVVPA